MAKARQIVLRTRTFDKAGDAMKFFQQMLHRYSIGATISDQDTPDLLAVLERHDDKIEKVGVGIAHFEVGAPTDYPGRCFWLVRTDGSRDNFSFKHCLEPKPYD